MQGEVIEQLWSIITKPSEDGVRSLGKTAETTAKKVEQGRDALGRYAKGAGEAAKQSAKMGRELESMKKFALGAVAGFVGFRAIKGFLDSATQASIDFGKGLSEVTTLLGNRSVTEAFGKDLAQVKAELLGMAGGLGSAKELTAALYEALSAGVDPAKGLAFVEQASKLATAGLSTTKEAVDVLTTALNAYHLGAEEATRVSDVLFKTVELGKTTVPDLAKNLGEVIPIAATLGVKVEDLGAALATMTAAGINTAESTTALNALLNGFVNEADAFREAGVDILGVLRKDGLAGAFAELERLTGGNIEEMKVFIPNVRALKAALSGTGESSEAFRRNLEAMQGATGATDRAFNTMRDTAAFVAKDLKEKFGAALVIIGDSLLEKILPAVRQFIGDLGPDGVGQAAAEASRAIDEIAKSGSGVVATMEEVKGVIEGAVQAPVSWAEIFISSFTAVGDTVARVRIVLTQAFTFIAGAVTQTFLTVGETVADVLASIIETAGTIPAALAQILPDSFGGEFAAKAAGAAKSAADAIRGALDFGGDSAAGFEDTLQRLQDELDGVGVAARDASVQGKMLGPALSPAMLAARGLGEAAAAAGGPTKALGDSIGGTGEKAQKAVDGLRKSIGLISGVEFATQAGALTSEMEHLREIGVTSGPVFDALAAKLHELGRAGVNSNVDIEAYGGTFEGLAIAMKETIPPLKDSRAAMLSQAVGATSLEKELSYLSEGTETTITWMESLKDGTADTGEALRSAVGDVNGLVGAFANGSLSLKDGIGGVLGILDKAKGVKGGIGSVLGEAFKGGGSATGGFTAGLENLAANVGNKAMSTGQKIGGAVGTGVGMYFGGPLGAAIGGKVGTFIGGLIQKPPFKKVQKDVQKNLGVALSEGTAQAIVDASKAAGVSTKIGTLLSLDKIIAEAKIDGKNAGKFAAQFDQLTKLAQSGAKGSTEAIKSIGSAFPALIGKFREAGMEGSKAFGDLIKSAKGMASTVPEIAAFMEQSTAKAVGGLGKLFNSIRLTGVEAFDRLGKISTGVLGALASLPGGGRKAIEALGDSIDKIAAKAKAAGLAVPEGIAGLIGKREFFKANADLYDTAEALTEIAQGLSDANNFDPDSFLAVSQQATATVDQLLAAGASTKDAYGATQQVLQALVNDHNRYGTAIDATTQGYIDQAAALGLVKIQGNDAFAMADQQTNKLLQGMAVIFGKEGQIAKFINETSNVGTTTATNVSTAWGGAATAATDSWSNAKNIISDSHASITSSVAGAANVVNASIASSATAAAASVSGVAESAGGSIQRLLHKIKWLRDSGGDIGALEGALPKFHGGGYTGDGSGEFMAKLKRREFVLDEQSTSRLGGERALAAAQRGDDSLLRSALGAVSSSRDARVPVRASASDAGAAAQVAAGPTSVSVFIGGRQLTPDVVEIVSRGNRERTIARQHPEEIV